MNEGKLWSRDNKILLCVWVLLTVACVLTLLAKQGFIGFGDVVSAMLYACFLLWLWRRPSPSRQQRYEVVVVSEPEHSRPLIEERRN